MAVTFSSKLTLFCERLLSADRGVLVFSSADNEALTLLPGVWRFGAKCTRVVVSPESELIASGGVTGYGVCCRLIPCCMLAISRRMGGTDGGSAVDMMGGRDPRRSCRDKY